MRAGSVAYLERARTQAASNGAEIESFHERVERLQTAEAREAEQKAVLVVAFEELRAQHAMIQESLGALEDECARYIALFDNAPDAYFTTDSRGVIAQGNPAAASLLGMARDQLAGKLLIAFVARRDTHTFRAELATATAMAAQGSHVFSLMLRPRGGAPFAATLSVRGRRRIDGALELHWAIRAKTRDMLEDERALLADIGRELRLAGVDGRDTLGGLADDLEMLSAPSVEERSAIAPALLVQKAFERAIARTAPPAPDILVGSLEPGVTLSVSVERTTRALARVFLLLGKASLRGWRAEGSFVLEVRAREESGFASQTIARAAIEASLRAQGGRFRVSVPDDDGDDGLLCEIALPLAR